MKPLLEVFVCTWNEEKILPDFIKWYRTRVPDCLITVWDNKSDDQTPRIALDNECKLISFDTGGYMDEQTLVNIRNNCWKQSEAKWCLVVDADELVDVSVLCLENWIEDIIQCTGYEMFGVEGDTIEKLLYGCESAGYCKPVLFKKDSFKEINFSPGSHTCSPVPINEDFSTNPTIILDLYHTKWRSWTNGIERARLLAKRRSEHSKQMGWNFHYELDESVHKEYYENGIRNRKLVR